MKAQINIDSWVKILPCDFGFLVRNVYNFFFQGFSDGGMRTRKCIEYHATNLYPPKYLRQLPAN